VLQRRVRRAMTLTTLYVAVVCVPAGSAMAELGDADPGGGNATTSTTVDTTATTEPSPDSSTTTTTTITDDSTTTTTVPADDDADTTTTTTSTTTSTTTPTTGPGPSTTSTSIPSSRGTGRSTTTTRPLSTTTAAPGSTVTTAPALSPAGAMVTNDAAEVTSPGGDGGGSGGSSPSGRSGRTTHPSPTRPDRDAETTAENPPDPLHFPGDTPVPPGIDPTGLGGLLGLGAVAGEVPAGVASDLAPTDLESALPSRDQGTSSSVALLGLSLFILLALAGGIAYRWWDRRPERYWPA